MYTSGPWGAVFALDAATGRLLWRFDPHVDGQVARYAGVDVVNRGVAVWHGKVYVLSLDCQAFALDARTGAQLWKTATAEGPQYTCCGADDQRARPGRWQCRRRHGPRRRPRLRHCARPG